MYHTYIIYHSSYITYHTLHIHYTYIIHRLPLAELIRLSWEWSHREERSLRRGWRWSTISGYTGWRGTIPYVLCDVVCNGMGWDGMGCSVVGWDGMGCGVVWCNVVRDGMGWGGVGWGEMGCGGMKCDGMGWDETRCGVVWCGAVFILLFSVLCHALFWNNLTVKWSFLNYVNISWCVCVCVCVSRRWLWTIQWAIRITKRKTKPAKSASRWLIQTHFNAHICIYTHPYSHS